jgi:hypothetical protein
MSHIWRQSWAHAKGCASHPSSLTMTNLLYLRGTLCPWWPQEDAAQPPRLPQWKSLRDFCPDVMQHAHDPRTRAMVFKIWLLVNDTEVWDLDADLSRRYPDRTEANVWHEQWHEAWPSRRSRENGRFCLTQMWGHYFSCAFLCCCKHLQLIMVSDWKWAEATWHAKPVRRPVWKCWRVSRRRSQGSNAISPVPPASNHSCTGVGATVPPVPPKRTKATILSAREFLWLVLRCSPQSTFL